MSLRERAYEQGGPVTGGQPTLAGPPAADPVEHDELPDIQYTAPIVDVDQVPVHVAWARVMRDVKSVSKSARAEIKTEKGSYRFNYRGIDMVLNAVGPALRRHGVLVIPIRTDASYGTAGRMRECTVTVTYRVYGPLGDHFDAQACGEGLDAGERATAKALTTAYRNWLTTALTIPTEDPKLDPDRVNLEREEHRFDPIAYRDEALNPRTSVARLSQMVNDLRRLGHGGELVQNETGDEEKLGNLILRVKRERTAPPPADDADWPDVAGPGGADRG